MAFRGNWGTQGLSNFRTHAEEKTADRQISERRRDCAASRNNGTLGCREIARSRRAWTTASLKAAVLKRAAEFPASSSPVSIPCRQQALYGELQDKGRCRRARAFAPPHTSLPDAGASGLPVAPSKQAHHKPEPKAGANRTGRRSIGRAVVTANAMRTCSYRQPLNVVPHFT